MKTRRIHIMGASGAGVTSLGRALADALSNSHHDTDDYFWKPTNPPTALARAATSPATSHGSRHYRARSSASTAPDR
jgi:adenylate kinase family enzyme